MERRTALTALLFIFVREVLFVSGGGCGKKTEKDTLVAIPHIQDFLGSVLQIVSPTGGVFDCTRELASEANTYWQGVCDGGGEANFLQFSMGDAAEPKTFGSFQRDGKVCTVLPDADGETQFRCVDDDFGEEPEVDEFPDFLEDDDEDENGGRRLFAMEHSIDSLNHRRLYDDSGSTIDILMVWSKKAECLNSGLPEGCTLTAETEMNMLGLSFLAVAETNAAFALSNVDTRLRLVHGYRTPDYEEPNDANAFRTILRDLARRSDLEMRDVHVQRFLYGADIVHMIVGASGGCGRAFLGPNIRSAFSVSNYACTSGLFSLGHEVAHSFGARHDRETLGFPPDIPLSGYKYGYRDADLGYRTIMAYPCEFGQRDTADTPSSCPRLQRFSNNITLTDEGYKLGDEFHNVARTINEASAKIAAFFPAMDCITDDQCDDQVNTTIDICDPFRRVCIFQEDLSESEPSKTCYASYLQSYYLGFWQLLLYTKAMFGFS